MTIRKLLQQIIYHIANKNKRYVTKSHYCCQLDLLVNLKMISSCIL